MGISEVSTLELELQQELVETTVCRLGINRRQQQGVGFGQRGGRLPSSPALGILIAGRTLNGIDFAEGTFGGRPTATGWLAATAAKGTLVGSANLCAGTFDSDWDLRRQTASTSITGGPPLDGRDLQQEQQRCLGGSSRNCIWRRRH